jgi:hypothetical protein
LCPRQFVENGLPKRCFVIETQSYFAEQYRKPICAKRRQVLNIFFRAQKSLCSSRDGARFQFGKIGFGIEMMIAEGRVTDEPDSPFCEVVAKSGWIADAAKRKTLLLAGGSIIFCTGGLAVRFHVEQFGASVKDGRGSVALNDRLGGWGVFAAGDDDDIGAAERGDWFAKAARGKKMASDEGIRRVEQDNIDIAGELEMLKTVIENKAFDAARFQFPALRETIRAHADGYSVTQAFMKESGLVIPAGRNFDPSDGARSLRQRMIAARQDCGFSASLRETLREPDGHGSFSRAPDSEIADTDDDAAQAALMDNTCAVTPRAQTCTGAVKNRKRPQK